MSEEFRHANSGETGRRVARATPDHHTRQLLKPRTEQPNGSRPRAFIYQQKRGISLPQWVDKSFESAREFSKLRRARIRRIAEIQARAVYQSESNVLGWSWESVFFLNQLCANCGGNCFSMISLCNRRNVERRWNFFVFFLKGNT